MSVTLNKRWLLDDVNDRFNSLITYTKDPEKDYWQTPNETMERKRGDCEDIAIAKYYELRSCGGCFNDNNMFLAFVHRGGEGHLVLMVRAEIPRRIPWWKFWKKPVLVDTTLVLDNAEPRILPLEQTEYEIQWHINETEYIIHASGIRYEPDYKPQWADMIRRMKVEAVYGKRTF